MIEMAEALVEAATDGGELTEAIDIGKLKKNVLARKMSPEYIVEEGSANFRSSALGGEQKIKDLGRAGTNLKKAAKQWLANDFAKALGHTCTPIVESDVYIESAGGWLVLAFSMAFKVEGGPDNKAFMDAGRKAKASIGYDRPR